MLKEALGIYIYVVVHIYVAKYYIYPQLESIYEFIHTIDQCHSKVEEEGWESQRAQLGSAFFLPSINLNDGSCYFPCLAQFESKLHYYLRESATKVSHRRSIHFGFKFTRRVLRQILTGLLHCLTRNVNAS